jgi:hypothetical protein
MKDMLAEVRKSRDELTGAGRALLPVGSYATAGRA